MATAGRSTLALIGDPYVRSALREGLAARLGRGFEPRRCTELAGSCTVGVLQAGDTLFIDASYEWDEAPSTARVAALTGLGVEAAIVAFAPSSRRLSHDLVLVRRAGIRRVAGLIRAGTVAPAADDDKALEQAQRAFRQYLSFAGWPPAHASTARVTIENPATTTEAALAALAGARLIEPLRAPGRLCFACARCGTQLCGAVSDIAPDELDRDWASCPHEDEALVPPGRYLRGDGSKQQGGWFETSTGMLYFHEADWLDPIDNGNGLLVTCCGARPDPTKGFNLSCPNGHLLGEIWTDCCSPQGVHVPAENLVPQDASEAD
jgi:hypothetical protein